MVSKMQWIAKVARSACGLLVLGASVGGVSPAHGQETLSVGAVDNEVAEFPPPFGKTVLGRLLEGTPNDPTIWASADYLLWFTQATPIPPILTTGPESIVGPSGRAGVLGKPGTQVLIGDTVGFTPASGVRINGGIWLDSERQFGIEGSYLLLPNRINNRVWSSTGAPGTMPLSIPFYNTQAQAQDTTGLAVPGGFGGTAHLNVQTFFQTAEVNMLHRLTEYNDIRFDGLLGYRWGQFEEVLQYNTPSNLVAQGNPAEYFSPTDRFHTTNNYYAGQIGLRASKGWGRLGLSAWAKIAMGGISQQTKINGALYTNDFTNYTAIQGFPGGYYAQATNSGYHSVLRFAVMPELGLNGSIFLLDWLKLNVGYTFLYMSNVARPGDQISTFINPSQSPSFTGNPNSKLVGVAAPVFTPASSDWWAHGMNFGLEFVW